MGRRDFFEEEKRRKIVMTFALAVGLAIIAFVTVFVMYSKKLNDEAEANLLAITKQDENIVSNEELEEASFSSDKTVQNVNYENQVKVELEQNTITESKPENTAKNETKTPESKEPVPSVVEEPKQEETPKEPEQPAEELSFQAPVVGEITKDYVMDTLVYSETLDEWCTHSGVDIKADKASVVLAAEKGTVESIKNDPRY